MVRAFHAAGIEVYLDVVFNHTGEGDYRGRTSAFRGLDNKLYYMIAPDGKYLNFSGCGNTVNCNHPLIRDLILTCLRYWVADMHIDGLRFDLASVLGRDPEGHVLSDPPVVDQIAQDGVLADTKLIAEPWDAAGLYQVGGFASGGRWSEWNGQYRDDVRRFWARRPGPGGGAGDAAVRLGGPVREVGAAAVALDQLHHLPRRVHAVGPGQLQQEAQPGQRRGGARRLDENFSWNCARRARPTTRRCCCVAGRPATRWRRCSCRRGCRC
ncbi:MAG: hypothetical protein U0797_27860 [Gemmataceae bacterium]